MVYNNLGQKDSAVNTIIPTRLNKSGTSDSRIEWDLKRTEIERKQCPKYKNGNVLRLCPFARNSAQQTFVVLFLLVFPNAIGMVPMMESSSVCHTQNEDQRV